VLIYKGFERLLEENKIYSIKFLNNLSGRNKLHHLTGKVLFKLADPINSSALAPKGLK
jgi:hypothetical protein